MIYYSNYHIYIGIIGTLCDGSLRHLRGQRAGRIALAVALGACEASGLEACQERPHASEPWQGRLARPHMSLEAGGGARGELPGLRTGATRPGFFTVFLSFFMVFEAFLLALGCFCSEFAMSSARSSSGCGTEGWPWTSF